MMNAGICNTTPYGNSDQSKAIHRTACDHLGLPYELRANEPYPDEYWNLVMRLSWFMMGKPQDGPRWW